MYRHLTQARAFIPTLLVTGLHLPVTLLSQQSELLDKVRSNDLEAVEALVAAGVDLNEREEFYHMTP